MKVCSSQYGNLFGNNQIYFPYTIATLVSYCLSIERIKKHYNFEPVFLFKKNIEQDIEYAKDADVLLCSCYAWNWEITKYLAASVRRINPKCLIIFGGPQIPYNHNDFFTVHGYVDILVHGEGEVATAEILNKFILGNFTLSEIDIHGTETKFRKSKDREKIQDLSIIPSPYTSELIWKLAPPIGNINYLATWETYRGCPFSCAFCDWGAASTKKLRKFQEERIFAEAEWFGKNKILYVECCDSNFGLFTERDSRLVKKLSSVKQQYHFPEKINLVWIKNSSSKIIPIAKGLAESNLLRSISLSVQSLYPKTLEAIKRKNIKFDTLEGLIKEFAKENLPSYTELIMGLPEETVDSFKDSWNTIAGIYPLPMILVWNCGVYPNAPMNDREYRQKYKIETFKSPMFMRYSEKPSSNDIREYQYMVKSTSALSEDQMKEIYLFNWTMMVFHAFGLSEYIARYYYKEHGINYRTFYEKFIEFFRGGDGLIHKEILGVIKHADEGFDGKPWDYYDDSIGNISWTIEEAGWLHLTKNKNLLRMEFELFLQSLGVEENRMRDLLDFQFFVSNFSEDREKERVEQSLYYNWIEYFSRDGSLIETNKTYIKTVPSDNPDIIKWGYDIVWFGGRQKKCITKLSDITEK